MHVSGVIVDECVPDLTDDIGDCVRLEIAIRQLPDTHDIDEISDIVQAHGCCG